MGLDQHLYSMEQDIDPNTMYDNYVDGTIDDVGYWRKHPDLHGYIEALWVEAGHPGADSPVEDGGFGWSTFNGVPFELSEEDILNIIECSKKGSFGEYDNTTGFFFGETCDRHHTDTIVIMTEALKLKRQGKKIVYNSSW